ncbi:MAG: MFS transporter [Proteobacteria bacterium]|nr:MFS transporter [Pseudomonadota bacterium]
MTDKRLVILLLMLAYAFNSMDRSIIPIIGQSMKLDLQLSDAQLGLLSGTAFALLYAFGGLPIARLAERANRVNIISVALFIWSSLTALCGMAASFIQLLLIRMGVGVAEAGCSPPAHSLISDYIEPRRRASALSVYSCGLSLGYILAAAVGGYVTQHWGWRAACLLAGLPGIVMAVLIKSLIREPQRNQAAPPFSLRAELAELAAVGAALFGNWPVLNMLLGITVGAFAAYGFYAFMPLYFIRLFGLDYATAGLISAFTGGVAVALGILAGGFVADELAKRDRRWYALVPAIGGLISLPLYAAGTLDAGWMSATGFLALAGFFQYALLGPTFGVVQNVVGAHRRATATALLYIFLNVVALGGGPLFVGTAIDRFAERNFQQLQATESSTTSGSFKTSCLGGGVSEGQAVIATRCRDALARATRRGLLVSLLFFAWASLHYFLAVPGMRKALERAV